MGAADRAHEIDDSHDHQARRDDLHTQRDCPAALGTNNHGARRDDDRRNVPQVSAKRRRHSWADSKKSGAAIHVACVARGFGPVCVMIDSNLVRRFCKES